MQNSNNLHSIAITNCGCRKNHSYVSIIKKKTFFCRLRVAFFYNFWKENRETKLTMRLNCYYRKVLNNTNTPNFYSFKIATCKAIFGNLINIPNFHMLSICFVQARCFLADAAYLDDWNLWCIISCRNSLILQVYQVIIYQVIELNSQVKHYPFG